VLNPGKGIGEPGKVGGKTSVKKIFPGPQFGGGPNTFLAGEKKGGGSKRVKWGETKHGGGRKTGGCKNWLEEETCKVKSDV